MFFGGLGSGNPGGPPITAPEEIAASVLDNPAQRLRPFLPPGRHDRSTQFVVARARAVDARERAMVGARHAARRRQGRALRRAARRHGARARPARTRARRRCNLVGDASARPMLDALEAQPGRWDLSSLRLLGSGGSILSGDVKDALMDALPSVLAIVEGIGSSESPAQAVAVTTRDGAPSQSLTFAAKADTMVVDEATLRPVARGSGVVGRLATRGRVPLGYHKDPETQRAHVRRDRRRALVAARRHGDDRRRRHHPPARPGRDVHQHRRREGLPRRGRGRAEAPSRRCTTRSWSAQPDERFGQRVVAVIARRPTGTPRPISTTLQSHCRGSSRATRCRARCTWSTRSRAHLPARPTTRGPARWSSAERSSSHRHFFGRGSAFWIVGDERVGDAERRAAVILPAHEVELRLGQAVARRAVGAEEVLHLRTRALDRGALRRDATARRTPSRRSRGCNPCGASPSPRSG